MVLDARIRVALGSRLLGLPARSPALRKLLAHRLESALVVWALAGRGLLGRGLLGHRPLASLADSAHGLSRCYACGLL